jgi:hypothetical protein
MLTLSKGFKKPQNQDPGSVVFPAMEDNIQQLNDHTHDGVDSEKLDATSVDSVVSNILSANWSTISNGHYSQVVTMPAGLLFDTTSMEFRTTAGVIIFPSVAKASSTTYTIYVNDNTLALKAVYG